MDTYSKSIPGSVHAYEDRLLLDDKRRIYAVADGVTLSSQGSGGVAAELTLKLLEENYSGDIVGTMKEVHERVIEMKRRDKRVGETTLTGASLNEDQLQVANVGDSPAYLVRGDDLQNLIHEDKDTFGYITQVIGYPERIQVHHRRILLEAGDCVILASDGVDHVLNPRIILPLVRKGLSARDLVEALVEEAKARPAGYDDDKSLIFMKITRV